VSDDANTLSGTETRESNEPLLFFASCELVYTFSSQYLYLFLVHSVLLLLCICEASRDPSCIPCLESKSIFISSHNVRTRPTMFVFLAGVDHELCDHTPPPFFIIVRESCGVLATHALYLSLVSLSPRSLTPDPLQRILELVHFPSLRARRARSSRGLPVGPGPSEALCQGRSVGDADDALCTNRQYVDMNRSFAALSRFSTCPFLIPPALWLYRKTRCG